MRRLIAIGALAWLSLALGCAAAPAPGGAQAAAQSVGQAENACALSGVRIGMSAAQVESVVGDPASKEQKVEAGADVWYYPGGVVILQGDRVTFRFPPRESDG
jgi:outer membrane protein assembly factor BamE (lipoprotein component of BamABCDE complex)